MLCYRCGGHVKDGSEKCESCGQAFALGLKPGPIAGFGTGSRRHRVAIEGTPYRPGDAVARRYKIKDHVGAGPVGWVYRAADTETDVDVALKVVSPRFLQMPEERKAFLAEMQKARALVHPNLVRVYDFGDDQDRPFLAVQFLEGLTLRRIMDLRRQKGQGFSLKEVEPIVAQIAAALDAAQDAFAHGDLKPDNVIVLPDLLKLTDFGLATSLPRAPFMAAQKAGGVHRYLAPEFLVGEALDARTDVYSLGVMLGEMLAGTQYEPALDLVARNPALPRGVQDIFRRAVAPKPQDRFASAAELADELGDLLEHGEAPAPHANTRPNAPRPTTFPGGPMPMAAASAPQAKAPVPVVTQPPPAAEPDEVVIEEAHTDPRVRIARALAAQDEQIRAAAAEHVRNALPPAEPRRSPPPSGSAAVQIPGTLQTLVVPEPPPAAPVAALGKTGDVASIAARVGATPAMLTADTAVKAAPSAPPPPPAAAIPHPPPGVKEPWPPVLAPVSATAAAPAVDVAAASPAEALSAKGAEAAADEVAARAGAEEAELEGDEAERTGPIVPGEPPRPRRGRGRRKREEGRHGRRSPGAREARESTPPAPATPPPPVVAAPAAAPAAPSTSVASTVIVAAPVAAAAMPTAAVSTPAPAAPRSDPPAAPSFGRLVEKKSKLSAPVIAVGGLAVVIAAIAAFTLLRSPSAPAAKDAAKAEQSAPAKADAKEPAKAPAPAAAPAQKAEPQSARPAAAPTPEKPTAKAELEDRASRMAELKRRRAAADKRKNALLERMRARHEARVAARKNAAAKSKATERRRAQEEADPEPEAAPAEKAVPPAPPPPKAAADPAAGTTTIAAPPPPAPAVPARVVASPPAAPEKARGGIPGLDDGELVVAKQAPARKNAVTAVAMAAPAVATTAPAVATAAPAVATAAPAVASCPPGMARIPAGRASVGSPASDDLRNFGDRALAQIELAGYCIDKYEYPNHPGKLPRVGTAFAEAESLCQQQGKRLCSEEEWEKACKGPQGLRFPYGKDFDAAACNTQDAKENPRQIGATGVFARCQSGYGVYDLSGNAAEWTATAFEAGGSERTVKGGSAARPAFDDRCASRRKAKPGLHDVKIGFRCCADPK